MNFFDILDIKNWADYDTDNMIFFHDLDFVGDYAPRDCFLPSQMLELQNVLCYLGCLDSELL